MKYWNKSKKRHEQTWHKVRIERFHTSTNPNGHNGTPITIKIPIDMVWQVLEWCHQQPSRGKFHYTGNDWYFEKEHDAVMAALRWT